jgi:DNA-binding transcriptional regulator YhcF (GntR family)
MAFKLEEPYNLPYYLQLKNILKSRIQSGAIISNKLPPVRQSARDFGVSVNTVLRAYNELGREGIVTSEVGKGTFVNITRQELKSHNRQVLLKKIIEHALEEALSLEFSMEEFQRAVTDYITEKQEMMRNIRLCFIECNIEQLTYFTNHLELDPHIRRIPILLEDIRKQNKAEIQKTVDCDILVTSFYHLREVQKNYEYLDKPIIGINIEPDVTTLIQVARIPADDRIGIVTTSLQFKKEIREVLQKLNLAFSGILETNSHDNETVKEIVRKCDTVLVSPKQKSVVQSYARDGTKVIEFVFTPDRTSINNLKLAILELKKGMI